MARPRRTSRPRRSRSASIPRAGSSGGAPSLVGSDAGRRNDVPLRSITPRGYHFRLPIDRINDWHVRGLHSTAFMNALSIFFPLGETFFIHCVERHREFVKPGSQLERDVIAFTAQESFHSREHEEYNACLTRAGYRVSTVEWVVAAVLEVFEHGPRALALAGTVAIEHLTAVLGHSILSDDNILAGSEPHFVELWRWHSHEETEHKAVAYDVYEAAYGRGIAAYILRVVAFAIAMTLFMALFLPTFIYSIAHAGGLWDATGWRTLLRQQWAGGGRGVLRRLMPLFFTFFRPSFHPWDHDNSELLKKKLPQPRAN